MKKSSALANLTIALIVFTCSVSPTKTENVLPDDAVIYEGPFPTPGTITYVETGLTHSVTGYPGQIITIFQSSFKETDATALIKSQQGTIIGKYPALGFYLVKVTEGAEATFISAMDTNQNIRCVKPNICPYYMSDPALFIDDCQHTHGQQVSGAYSLAGGGYDVSCKSDDDGAGHPVAELTVMRIVLEAIARNGTNTYINISTSGPDEQDWFDLMEIYLTTVAALPDNLRANLVITFCAGNENFSLTNALANLRKDPLIADVLSKNVLIVGASETVFPSSNDAPGDPDFANMTSVDAPNMSKGTSFAAPQALALLHVLAEQYSLSARDALIVAKLSIAANSNHELIQTEANAQAVLFKSPQQDTGTYVNANYAGGSKSTIGDCIFQVNFTGTISITITGGDGSATAPYTGTLTFNTIATSTVLQGTSCSNDNSPIVVSGTVSGSSLKVEGTGTNVITVAFSNGTLSGNNLTGTLTLSGPLDSPITSVITLTK